MILKIIYYTQKNVYGQSLTVIQQGAYGSCATRSILGFRFVPLNKIEYPEAY